MSVTTRTFSSLAAVGLLSMALSTQTFALEGSWQVGINAGLSRLSPDTDGSDFTLDDDQSEAAGVYVGLDLSPLLSTELAFTSLGQASLSGNESIDYQAISLGATAYIWGEKEADRRSNGASGYFRVGLSSISNESDIPLDESDNIALWAGLGLQYPFSNNWGMRAELTSFDGDAQALMAGIFWRTGSSGRSNNSTIAGRDLRPMRPTRPAESTATEPSVGQNTSTEPVQTAPTAPVTPGPQIVERADPACPPEAAAKVADPQACALLSGIVPGLEFVGNSAELAPGASVTLDRVAAALKDYPALVLEIRAHAQSSSDPQVDAQLSSLRARAVARYLVQNGVPVSQLRAKAFGATRPIADSATAEGQRINNRIEFLLL